jgi:5-methyltetrahydropteroyltriglutamate--homocysteine methyltransferase
MNVHVGALTREQPPFRAEHIGSLLRPAALLQQRERYAHGEISQNDLSEAEDAAISQAIALQERLGLRFATDGEYRRRSYHSFFYQQLGDVSIDTIAGADA